MAIKRIDIYPQIYAYTKDYVDALVANTATEPAFSGDRGAWFGLGTDNNIFQYLMNPYLVNENATPLTIYDVPSSATNDIASIISYGHIIDYFKDALGLGTPISGSTIYVTIRLDDVDFVFPKYSTNPVLLPMRVRFFYIVTYGEDNLAAMFPRQINGYYETVLNATRNFKFTSDTASARWGAQPEWKLFTKTGELIDEATGLNTQLSSEYDEFYIAINVPILGGTSSTSVDHYDINSFVLDNSNGVEIATTSDYPSQSDLGELMAAEGSSWRWKQSPYGLNPASPSPVTYDNTDYYLASARFTRTILFKVVPSQCIDLMANPVLGLTYLDQAANDVCVTGYTASLTIDLVDLTLSSDGIIFLSDILGFPYSMVSISNPSDQLIDNITYSLKMKRYAIRTKTTSTGAIGSWGSLTTIAGDGIDVSDDCDISLPSSINAGASVDSYFWFNNYSNISDFANKCGYTPPAGKSIASGVFIFELEMSYGAVTKTTELAFRLGYEHCISMRTANVHEILQDSSKKWSGIKNVALTITEVNDPVLNKVESLNSLYTIDASLHYVSPVSKTITSSGLLSFGTGGSIGSYATMTGTTTKTVTLAGTGGKSWTPTYYANLQTGSAYLSILLMDVDSNTLTVQNASRIIDIVAPPAFDITTTPEGSEIDANSEAHFSE